MSIFDVSVIKTFEELEALVKKSEINYDLDLIKNAYSFSENLHRGQKRLTGELYITHCLTVAKYVVQLNLDTTSVVVALLHDATDKGNASIDEIDKKFGTEVAFIVDGMTNIRDFSKLYVGLDSNDIENFKHLVLASAEDIRVLLIRLSEKLHNVQTVDVLNPEQKKLTALRLLRIYAPLAEYLGLGYYQRVFQDTAFSILKPTEYAIVVDSINKLYAASEDLVNDFISDVTKLFNKYDVKFKEIKGRKKGIFSTYEKVKRKYLENDEVLSAKHFRKLKDTFAFRVIVENIEQCYLALGLIHSNWEYFEDEFDDYISRPKPNGYKSIHTVINYQGIDVEIQIRTLEMDEFSEFGPACHIAYKLQGSGKSNETLTWTKDLIKWKEKKDLTKEDFKLKVFSNSIFVFTPKGLVIRLDKDSTPLDFAFQIHTNVGYYYAGAKVNGKMVSMNHILQTGDVIEIITTNKINTNQDWLKCAKMHSTKYRIKRQLRKKELDYQIS
jgi:guanosine-3',5'-bis(diphosphate) 3'-pyrophosphohydrolase